MVDQEESPKETKRKEKRIKEGAERLAKGQERKKAYLAKEQAIEEAQKEGEPNDRISAPLKKSRG